MLFGKGNWAVLGLKIDSFQKFQATFQDPKKLFLASQLVGSIRTRFKHCYTVGINPFGSPRKDEVIADNPASVNLVSAGVEDIHDFLELDKDFQATSVFDPLLYEKGYGSKEEEFLLNSAVFGTYGFWIVMNDYDDVTDVASKKEGISYEKLGKPFKFTAKEDKTMVEATTNKLTVPIRKQFPVIVDFQTGRIFAPVTSTPEIMLVRELVANLGAEVESTCWDFDSPEWTRLFLQYAFDETKFLTEFTKRAEDRARFSKNEVEKLEDKTMERVVSTYFACTELPTEQWVALKPSTKVKLWKTAEPISISDPTIVTSLVRKQPNPEIVAATVVFQELSTRVNKKSEEITVRSDVFTLTLDDNINNLDAGAALLKGFDLPQYKADIKRFLKQEIKIADYWYQWLSGLRSAIEYLTNNVTEALDITKPDHGLKITAYGVAPQAPTVTEVSVA